MFIIEKILGGFSEGSYSSGAMCLRFFLPLVFLLFCPPSLSLCSAASVETDPYTKSQPVKLNGIAILPFENLSDDPEASRTVTGLITDELKKRGQFSIIETDAVEEFLAKRRIRYTGAITRITAREMGEVLGVDAVLVGSVPLFSGDTNGEVIVGVAARIVSADDGSIIWADTLSYSGNDFEGLLGLGVVKSLDKLTSRVVKELLADMPASFFMQENSLPPFEIAEVSTVPGVGKSGEKMELRVKVTLVSEEPQQVKATIDGSEIVLDRRGNGVYEGTLDVPDGEGIYTVNIIALDRSMAKFSFDAAGKIVIDNTPPKVSVTVNRKVFASRKKDFITFTPKMMSFDEIDEWTIEIVNKEGKRVRGHTDFGKLPKGLIWRGETDRRRQAEDGWYTYRFMVRDLAGNETQVTDKLRLKNKPPEIMVDVDMVDGSLLFIFDYDQDENIESWTLSIHDGDGVTMEIMEGKGDIPKKLEYPVGDGFDINKMTFSVIAVDGAGNSFNLTKSIPSMLFRKSPFAKKTPFAKARQRNRFVKDF
jgi:TolB-like protein